jgi:hypothetical protein
MDKNCVDNAHKADWIREMNAMEHDCDEQRKDNSFEFTGWPYAQTTSNLLGGGDPYKRQEGGGHYHNFAIQPHEYIVKNDIPWSAANAIKYLSRYRLKGGKQDLLKARHYIDLAIAEEYPD